MEEGECWESDWEIIIVCLALWYINPVRIELPPEKEHLLAHRFCASLVILSGMTKKLIQKLEKIEFHNT